ncbi:MAG: hypothetical protein WB586_22735 [Chthoniobacterales bacterium]
MARSAKGSTDLAPGDESPRTTKLYDRTKDEITIGKVERIQL